MTDVNPWADPSVKAKINQQGLGPKGAPRAESRRLATPPAPPQIKAVVVYGIQEERSNIGTPTLHLLRYRDKDLVMTDRDVANLAGSGLTFSVEGSQFFVDGRPVLRNRVTFPVNWVIQANGQLPLAFIRKALWWENKQEWDRVYALVVNCWKAKTALSTQSIKQRILDVEGVNKIDDWGHGKSNGSLMSLYRLQFAAIKVCLAEKPELSLDPAPPSAEDLTVVKPEAKPKTRAELVQEAVKIEKQLDKIARIDERREREDEDYIGSYEDKHGATQARDLDARFAEIHAAIAALGEKPLEIDEIRAEMKLDPVNQEDKKVIDDFATPAAVQAAQTMLDSPKSEPVSPFKDDVQRRRFWGKVNPAMKDAGLDSNKPEHRLAIYVALGVSEYVGKIEHPSYMYTGDMDTAISNTLRTIQAVKESKKNKVSVPVKTTPNAPAMFTSTAVALTMPGITATTVTGVPVGEIAMKLDRPYPDKAYTKLTFGPMAGKSDLKFGYVRNRLDEVFGPQGFGWKLEAHPVLGHIVTESYEEMRQKKDRNGNPQGEPYKVTMWRVSMVGFTLKYLSVDDDHETEKWIEGSLISDSHSNEDLGYAYRGAFTSLMKQAVRLMGGFNHLFGLAEDEDN